MVNRSLSLSLSSSGSGTTSQWMTLYREFGRMRCVRPPAACENQEIRPPPFHDGNVHAAPIVAPIFVNTGHQPPRSRPSSYLRTRTITGGSINGTVRARPNSRTCPSGWKISLRRNGASISYHRSPRSTIDPPPPPLPLPSPARSWKVDSP